MAPIVEPLWKGELVDEGWSQSERCDYRFARVLNSRNGIAVTEQDGVRIISARRVQEFVAGLY